MVPIEEQKYFDNVIKKTKEIINENENYIEKEKKRIEKNKREIKEREQEYTGAELYNSMDEEDLNVLLLNKIIRKNISLYHSLETPYFARIDFKDSEKEKVKAYIGTTSIERDGNILVYDWRAPISNLYYNYGIGKAVIETPKSNEEVEITLKRQYQIKMGKLLNIIDTDAAIDDELLQDVLVKSPTKKMQNIVSTIQKEQNNIIRYKGKDNLIIEGIAGSGKTAIILHRVAYLLYNENDLTSKNVIIVSPNEVFSEYISGVLPELGEENIKSISLDMILKNLIKVPVESQGDYLNRQYINDYKAKKLDIKNYDKYLKEYKDNLHFEKSMGLNNVKITKEELNELIKKKKNRLNISSLIDYITSYVLNKFGIDEDKNFDNMQKIIKKQLNVKDDALKIYSDYLGREIDHISYEEVAYVLYLYYEINGYPDYSYIKHLIIDEAQDYDVFEIKLLKKIFNSAIFTIVGDINQRLNKNVNNTLENLTLDLDNSRYIKLSKTYRSSREITEYACNIIGNKEIKSIRDYNGINVLIKNEENLKEDLINDISKFKSNNYESIAIITKTKEEADMINGLNIDKMIKALPFYLAKGLEFEGVIIYTSKDDNLKNDKNLHYVMATRAREALVIYNQKI